MKGLLSVLILLSGILGLCRAESVPYPKGCYAMWPVYKPLSPEVLDNPGFVGIYLQFVWSDVEKEDNVFDWSRLDARLQEAQNAGLKVVLSIRADLTHAPQWLKEN